MEKDITVRAIIEQIEADPEGRYKTDKEIAAMVGRSCSSVSRIRREIRQSKAESEKTGHKVPVDKGGWEIPPHLQEIFEQRKFLTGLIRQLELAHGQTKRLIESNHPLAAYFNPKAYLSTYHNLHSQLSFALPYAVCRLCGGDGGAEKNCRACKGAGWVNEAIYRETLKILKSKARQGMSKPVSADTSGGQMSTTPETRQKISE